MYCSYCGKALSYQMKFCNYCGVQLVKIIPNDVVISSEKNLREEMVDLFWVTVFGLGLILGGMFLIKRILSLSEWVLFVYLILSTTAFTINFALSLWQIRRLSGIANETRKTAQTGQLTSDVVTAKSPAILVESLPNVTEHTTQNLDL